MDPGIANHTLPEEFEEVVVPEMLEKEVGAKVDVKPTLTTSSPAPSYIELIDPGVHNIEIYAEMYNRPIYRVALFFSLFLIAYAYGLDGNIRYTFQAYATSSYSQHSLLSTVNCIKTVIAAVGQIFFARLSDIFGRFSIMIVSIIFYSMGTIIESQAVNITRFAVGGCFYQLGLTGIILILEVIASDFSNLNWRLLALFIPALPFIINTWIGGNVTSAIGANWKWGIGMWAFILPLACIPLGICMLHMRYLARKHAKDRLKPEFEALNRLKWKSFCIDIAFWKLDIIGMLLITVFFGCVLVPFTLAGGLKEEWKTAHIIVPEVIGWVVVLPLYMLWEIKYSRHPLTPWDLIQDRGIFFALLIAFFINFNWYMQGDYMYTVLVVAVHESIKSATRITSLYSFVSVIVGTILGFILIKVRRTKPFIIFGISCWIVSFGLLVHYRGDSGAHSGIIGSLCLLGFGAGSFTYVTQASIQASAKTHARMAVVTSLYLATYNIGSAFGSSVSGAVWTNILPKEISKRISDPTLAAQAYGSPFTFITTYTWGTPERIALVMSYRYVQKILCIIGLVFCFPLLGCAFMLRNHKLTDSIALEGNDHLESKNTFEIEEKEESFLKNKFFTHFTSSKDRKD
ncbi:ANL_collapsed_G0013810.mRNA.1.CDS.1 [Saccharomyces cerevisiae]|nr:ANL_HP_G0050110.mRNA.1.CDS.1 [Saccharomyces cerevisiae]CAI4997217.1 ANL_HP_G0003070.mRNA.1.CDS.1 [Saccharomyces cerevisiae]CAI6613249.1 ANL_collapsed_G0013810.mRNA.1.CDS.1 [Saccharomyces cerevisiae]CAI6875860.1 ANL_HP_G0050110.mRNA.1.CDS.1 [Saccharomyces cerevisiae]CAI6888694.1 ANL_HP_G0003070.mRNA.1.CDS.1 [Saccharomyces cerevisiae]